LINFARISKIFENEFYLKFKVTVVEILEVIFASPDPIRVKPAFWVLGISYKMFFKGHFLKRKSYKID
jgi:hypothetical protein